MAHATFLLAFFDSILHTISTMDYKRIGLIVATVLLGVLVFTVVALVGMRAVYAGKIYPNVSIGAVDVSGLTKAEALEKISKRIEVLEEQGITVKIGDKTDVLRPSNLNNEVDAEQAVVLAVMVGREGSFARQIGDLLSAPWRTKEILLPMTVDERAYDVELANFQALYASPGSDVRLSIDRTVVKVLDDVKSGFTLDIHDTRTQLINQLVRLDNTTIVVPIIQQEPVIDPATADEAIVSAERMLAEPLVLRHDRQVFTVSRADIGQWITSTAVDRALVPAVDEQVLAAYVAEMGEKINNIPQTADIQLDENGKIVDFVPPQAGEVLEEAETIQLIIKVLHDRRDGVQTDVSELALPVVTQKPRISASAAELGIEELIGVATTSFAGSPQNRRLNIANGTKFLTGALIAPGEEFSTIKTLGVIDNTTGYLPELVIKGDRTIPEFGGGLCQVSTTLFRSVLNAGLPVTSRRNHSYRVGYYERDGAGNYIGPGLDATIYDPAPDFRFKNDTAGHILVRGYVHGDLVTFELYGKTDGRQASVDGPHTLSTTPAGKPIYGVTSDLPAGTIKKIESAHPGGTAIATYSVKYSDGRVETQEFKSFYRPWPERFLVGEGTDPTKYLSPEEIAELEKAETPTDTVEVQS